MEPELNTTSQLQTKRVRTDSVGELLILFGEPSLFGRERSVPVFLLRAIKFS